jgi:hypothetical protein
MISDFGFRVAGQPVRYPTKGVEAQPALLLFRTNPQSEI